MDSIKPGLKCWLLSIYSSFSFSENSVYDVVMKTIMLDYLIIWLKFPWSMLLYLKVLKKVVCYFRSFLFCPEVIDILEFL